MSDTIECLISEEEIDACVRRLARRIAADSADGPLRVVCVLKGASFFACDLARRLELPVYMDFISLSSYGDGTESAGTVRIVHDLEGPVTDEDILVVEDIIDSGRSMDFLKKHLMRRGARSVRVCALLDKPSRREVDVEIDYIGFEIEDRFVVGYGLDYAQRYRNLPYIGEYVERTL